MGGGHLVFFNLLTFLSKGCIELTAHGRAIDFSFKVLASLNRNSKGLVSFIYAFESIKDLFLRVE